MATDTIDVSSMNETLPEEFYSNYMDGGKLIEQWVLTRSPAPVVTILALYYLLVLKVGPQLMENRRPYKLKTVMRLYNIVQVTYNSFMIYNYIVPHHGVHPLPFLTSISCSFPADFDGIEGLKYLYLIGGWNYVVLKILDLLDTVFMVLRKKNSHITVLHVYHHGAMVMFPWFCLKYIKATQGGIPVLINLIVHAIMYGYYFLSTFSAFKKYLWWKRHLTRLQMLQFAIVLGYVSSLYYRGCRISRLFTYIWAFNMFIFICLFINFYVKAYIFKKPITIKHAKRD